MSTNPSPFWGGVIQYCRDNKLSPDASKAVMEKAAKIAPHALREEFEKHAVNKEAAGILQGEFRPWMWGSGTTATTADLDATNKKMDTQLYRQHGTGPAARKAQGLPEIDINAPSTPTVNWPSGKAPVNNMEVELTDSERHRSNQRTEFGITAKPVRGYWDSVGQNLGHFGRLAPAGIRGLGGYGMGGIADLFGYPVAAKELYRQGDLGFADSARSSKLLAGGEGDTDYAQEYWNRRAGIMERDPATGGLKGRTTPHFTQDFGPTDTDLTSKQQDFNRRLRIARQTGRTASTSWEGALDAYGNAMAIPIPGAGTTNLVARAGQAARVAQATRLIASLERGGVASAKAIAAAKATLATAKAPGVLNAAVRSGPSFLPARLGGGLARGAAPTASMLNQATANAWHARQGLSAAGGLGGYGAPTVSAVTRAMPTLAPLLRQVPGAVVRGGITTAGRSVGPLLRHGWIPNAALVPAISGSTGYTGSEYDPPEAYDLGSDVVEGVKARLTGDLFGNRGAGPGSVGYDPTRATDRMSKPVNPGLLGKGGFGSPEEMAKNYSAAELIQLSDQLAMKTNEQMDAGRFGRGAASIRNTQQTDFIQKARQIHLTSYDAELTKQGVDPTQMRTYIYEAVKTDMKAKEKKLRTDLYVYYRNENNEYGSHAPIDFAPKNPNDPASVRAAVNAFEAQAYRDFPGFQGFTTKAQVETSASWNRDNPDLSGATPESFNDWRQSQSPLKVKPAAPAAPDPPSLLARPSMEVRGEFKPSALEKRSAPSTSPAVPAPSTPRLSDQFRGLNWDPSGRTHNKGEGLRPGLLAAGYTPAELSQLEAKIESSDLPSRFPEPADVGGDYGSTPMPPGLKQEGVGTELLNTLRQQSDLGRWPKGVRPPYRPPSPTTPLGIPHDDPRSEWDTAAAKGLAPAAPTGGQPRPAAPGEPAGIPGEEPSTTKPSRFAGVSGGTEDYAQAAEYVNAMTQELGSTFQSGRELTPELLTAVTPDQLNKATARAYQMTVEARKLPDHSPVKHELFRSIVRIRAIESAKVHGLQPEELPKWAAERVASVEEGGITNIELNEAIATHDDAKEAWAAAQKTSDPVGAMKKWAGERTSMEWGMMAVGIPLALMGVMNMMSGEGGIGSVIMGILGIGLGLAGGGMFGAGPGQFAEQQGSSLMDMVGGLFGRNAPEAASEQEVQNAYGTPAQPGPLPHTPGSMGPNAPENRVGSAQPGAPAPPAAPAQPNAQAVAKAQRTKIYNFAQAFPALKSFGSTPKETGLSGVFDSPEDVSALVSSWASPAPWTTNDRKMQVYVSAIRKNPDMVKAIVAQLSTPESIAKFKHPGLLRQGEVKRQQLIRALQSNYQLGTKLPT